MISGVKKFNYFLAGRSFVIRTDHKPLLGLIGERKPLPEMISSRMLRWALLLGAYDYHLEFMPGAKQGHCDGLSRLPLPQMTERPPTPAEVVNMLQFLDSTPITAAQIRLWTSRDPVLSAVLRYTKNGWPADANIPIEFRPYQQRIGELSCQDGCLLWGGRVIVPQQGREKMLKLLHEGHLGESRTKAFARAYIWWPRMDDDIVRIVSTCRMCNERRNQSPNVPIHPWEWPARPWDRVHIDFCGPLDGMMFLVVIDAHSKWVDIYPTKATTTAVTLDKLRTSFAAWGLPRIIVSDNAACFTCPAFQQFCAVNGIRHVTSPPYAPKSNGLAERCVQTFKRGYRMLTGSVSTKVSRFLFQYRSTPHTTTSKSPAELFLGRQLRTHMDRLRPDVTFEIQGRQRAQKWYRDQRSQFRQVKVGDTVWVTALDRLQGIEGCSWLPGEVLEVAGIKVTVLLFDSGKVVQRHMDHVRRGPVGEHRPPSFDDVSVADPVPAADPVPEITPAPPVIPAPAPRREPERPRAHPYNLRPRPTPCPDRL